MKKFGLFLVLFIAAGLGHAEQIRVATFNLRNYLDVPVGTRHAKDAKSKAKIVQSILAIKPDVLALEEMGTTNALLELRDSLKKAGLDYPFWEHVSGYDNVIHLAVLSRYEISYRQPHTNESYLLGGRRLRVMRGFLEVGVRVNPRYAFTLIAAHLKSQLPSPVADQADMREQEALLLCKIVDSRFASNARTNLIVLGDLNDSLNSRPLQILRGHGNLGLFDTRPVEQNSCGERSEPPLAITWTYFYNREDVYSRLDYILISPEMKRQWLPRESYVLRLPQWGIASDHCPVTCAFEVE